MSVSIKKEAELEGEPESVERKEKAEGEPMYDKESDIPGVDISEDYQSKAHEMTHKASKHELHHLQRKIDDRHEALRKEERSKEQKPKHMKNVPEMYSAEDMPMD